ncbi:hypothetical protein WI213_24475 (plasmid) [Salmonella enterica subsp. enterica serovar Infantis]
MKNIFVATGMLSLAFSGGVQAYDGTINFVGKILTRPAQSLPVVKI